MTKTMIVARKTKPQRGVSAGVLRDKCLTMTYFHRRPSTIIGAKAFHSPVRDGKVWDHLAMVVKRNWLPSRLSRDAPANWKKHTASDQYGSTSSGYEGVKRGLRCTSILRSVVNNLTHYN